MGRDSCEQDWMRAFVLTVMNPVLHKYIECVSQTCTAVQMSYEKGSYGVSR
jgi:hypothetical protein